jgi:hypothetical protein
MSDLKTRPTTVSPQAFIKRIPDEARRRECLTLLSLMKRATGTKPRMWGDSIVGFGSFRYRYGSGREGEWFVAGFSPRKHDLTVYILAGLDHYRELLARLGKHRTGRSCLYLKRLADADLGVLEQLVADSVRRFARARA